VHLFLPPVVRGAQHSRHAPYDPRGSVHARAELKAWDVRQ
jgi:hypothetical protein